MREAAGAERWSVVCSAWEDFIPTLDDDSVDLLITSGPYEAARTYGIGFGLSGQAWVDWMVALVRAAAPKVKGLIALNCEGQTRDYRYSAVPYLLMADLHRAGFNLRRPVTFHRVGIPGSGGPDWLRGDTEPVICITRPGRLPWSDNTACGHPPKWAPGGEPSHRTVSGSRINQWGMRMGNGSSTATRNPDGSKQAPGRPSHVNVAAAVADGPGLFGDEPVSAARQTEKTVPSWLRDGMHSGVQNNVRLPKPKRGTNGSVDGDTKMGEYDPPALANPGNVVQAKYTSDEVASLLADAGDALHLNVGGGCMGHELAHENEAPFPVELPAFFIKSFCPPGGLVLDPFAGSGTTAQAAVENGRRFIGCDVRQSQVDLVRRRMATVTPSIPGMA